MQGSKGGTGLPSKALRIVIVVVAVAAVALVLYGILQVFVCDFREVVFRGMSRRAIWLCG